MPRLPPLSQLRNKNVFALSRLPIPSLEATRERYVRSCRGLAPVVADNNNTFTKDLDAHLASLDAFVQGSGPKMQKELEERDLAAAMSNDYPYSYIEPLWDDGYLEYDDPCPINVAPGFTSRPLDPSWSQAQVAAKLARSCAKWFIAATEGTLTAPWASTTAGKKDGDAVCVAGLPVQMGFCRKPGALRDALHVAHTPESALRYVTVLRNGHVFLLSLVNQKGKLRSERSLAKGFETIIGATSIAASGAAAAQAEFPVPALTTSNRRDWFKSRSVLKDADPGNLANLRYVEDSLLCICLDDFGDDAAKFSDDVRLYNNLVGAKEFGLGGDSSSSSGRSSSRISRWYDKHQLIVTPRPGEGFGFTAEHAFSDGVAWCKWLNAVHADMLSGGKVLDEPPAGFLLLEKRPLEVSSLPCEPETKTTTTTKSESDAAHATTSSSSAADDSAARHHDDDEALLEQPVTEDERANHRKVKLRAEPAGADEGNGVIRLSFKLRGKTKKAIVEAIAAHDTESDNLQQAAVLLPFGKNHCKRTFKVGPDALCQAAYHVAYARIHKEMGAAYESCSTERFFHGRTETIRSATPEMNAFVRNVVGGVSSNNIGTAGELLRAAAVAHTSVAKDAASGQGIDRHLLALKDIVKELADPAGLAFFSQPMYGHTGTWVLSTSNVSQPSLDWFSFGPVTPAGYGMGYIVHEETVKVGVSAFRECGATDTLEMGRQIIKAAEEIVEIMSKKP